MNDHREHPNSDNDLTKDQMAEQGIEVDTSGTDNRRSENYREDLAEEATWPVGSAKQGASPKAAPEPESKIQGEDNDYYNGMSQ